MKVEDMQRTTSGIEPIAHCIDASLMSLQNSASYPLRGGISTGFGDLDESTSGIAPMSLNVIVGRPCMGATTLAFTIGLNIAIDQKRPCVIFSLTESKYRAANRLLALQSGVERERIHRVDLDRDQLNKISRAAEEIKSSPLFIVDSAFSVKAIQEKIERSFSYVTPAIVIIDDLSELAPLHDRRKVSKVVKQIKCLIHETGVAVILTSLLLRKLEKRKCKYPALNDLPKGLRLPSPDLLLMLYREAYYNPGPEMEVGTAEIFIGSNRHGSMRPARLKFSDGQFLRDA
jgi:replicative DNA helicase